MNGAPEKSFARVLYVDDNPHDIALVRHALEQDETPFELAVAPNWEAMQRHVSSGRFDAVVTDFNVLGYTGLEIVQWLRKRLKHLPIVLLTGTGSEEVAAEALRQGVDDYIIKTTEQIRQVPRRLKLLIEKKRLERENVEATRALISTSENYRELIRTSPDAMVIFDAAHRVAFANPAAREMFGPEIPALADKVFAPDRPSGAGPADIEIPFGHGHPRLGELRAAHITWEGAPATLAVIRDVTERARLLGEQKALAEASSILLQSENLLDVFQQVLERLKQVVGADMGYVARRTPDDLNAVVVLDAGTQACPLTLQPTPVRGLRALAYESSSPIFENDFPRTSQSALLPEGHPRVDNILLCPVRTREGVWGLVGLANKPGGFDSEDARITTAFADIVSVAVQRQRHLDALQESQSRFKAIFENTIDGIVLAELHSGNILLANEAMAQLLGTTIQELRQRSLSEFVPTAALVPGPPTSADKRPSRVPNEVTLQRPDGRTRQVEVQASPLDYAGKPVVVGVFRDVTEQKVLQSAVAQSDRLATMGMLAAAVAHEVNNPLSYLLYNLETGVEELALAIESIGESGGPARGRAHRREGLSILDHDVTTFRQRLTDIHGGLKEALQAAVRIKEISQGLGTFSRVEKPVKEAVDLVAAVRHAITIARNEIKYRARLVLDLEPVPPVLASEGRLAQVALNLLINAAQSIVEGDVAGNEIRVKTWTDHHLVCLEVSDTGQGIRPENLSQIFDPFYSTKPPGVGSGLGLTICKTIITQYGGDISVESTPGEGTRFLVQIPRAQGRENVEPLRAPQAVPAARKARGRILIVDDELAIRRMLARLLGREHDVVAAASGDEARELLERDRGFDVILCDVMMSTGSGMDLHRWLLDVDPVVAGRVVFMSGGAFTPLARDYLGSVDNARIEKPFDMATLRRLVSEFVNAARLEDPKTGAG